jgi:hypothetical protein
VYFPTPDDTPNALSGVIQTFCYGTKCVPMVTDAPHFTIGFSDVKRYPNLISEDYSKLPAEHSSEGSPLDLQKYDVTYQAKLLQIKALTEKLEDYSFRYTIPNKEIALFLAGLCGHEVGRGDLSKAITKCIEYMMERERPVFVIPEPPEEVPEERKPAPPPPLRKGLTKKPFQDWDSLFPK